ncbi:tetratricopeptide repeat protein [Bacillus chungangensis]|uniref:Negative regulator of RcsB-dependent stress response n=1 Tax=Bacillus chungangensis TaxID=587633 RepID=A0ABT9WQL0_9BACI|nr:tetratricopeptide repeat protein [Bacillus chungangensis]MDQ0175573.1 putative negative regulator of RcsB-dependent stress response [Bacillus chungangensis]
MGLSCVELKQFDTAKKYFLAALEMVKEDAQLTLILRYNLGFLFSEQNQSQEAISHLTEIYNKKSHLHHKVLFLLIIANKLAIRNTNIISI